MSHKPRNQRALVGLLVCFLLGMGSVLAAGGLLAIAEAADEGPLELVMTGFMVLLTGLVFSMTIFLPYGFIALGWLRLGDYEREELKDLPEDNTVGDPEAGERKYQEWLSAMNSTEAYLGMVLRSDPYVPPEQRPPENATRPKMRMDQRGWTIFGATLVFGATLGATLGHLHGLGAGGKHAAGLIQLITSAAVGMVLSFPFAIVLALLFGRVEQVEEEEEDDARGSGSETA